MLLFAAAVRSEHPAAVGQRARSRAPCPQQRSGIETCAGPAARFTWGERLAEARVAMAATGVATSAGITALQVGDSTPGRHSDVPHSPSLSADQCEEEQALPTNGTAWATSTSARQRLSQRTVRVQWPGSRRGD